MKTATVIGISVGVVVVGGIIYLIAKGKATASGINSTVAGRTPPIQ